MNKEEQCIIFQQEKATDSSARSQLKSISQTRKQLVLQYNCKHRHPVFLLFGFIPHDVVFMFKHKRLPWCSWWPHLDLFAVTALPVCITSQAQACTISESILQLQLHHFFSSKEELWVSFYSWRLPVLKSCLKYFRLCWALKYYNCFCVTSCISMYACKWFIAPIFLAEYKEIRGWLLDTTACCNTTVLGHCPHCIDTGIGNVPTFEFN